MRTSTTRFLMLAALLAGVTVAWAETGAEKLPAGPIQDRHDLMKEIGSHAKKAGDAIKAGNAAVVAENAKAIEEKSARIPVLFPKGSTDPHSRAKEEIWKEWERFEKNAQSLTSAAAELANAARSGQDMGQASGRMFGTCKSCHEAFRAPES